MQIFKMLFGLFAFLMFRAVDNSAGSLGYKFDSEHVKSWAEEGKKAGKFAMGIFKSAESAVKDMMVAVASKIAGSPSAEDFLTGYASSWSNPDTGKSRKTDFRAVMDAFALKDADGKALEYERIVGYEKNPDGTNKLDEKKNAIPIKITKSAQDWLLEYQVGPDGDFKGFLALARELRNRGTGRQSTGSTVSRKVKVTDSQFSNIMAQIPVMTQPQAHATILEANKQIAKLPNWEPVVLSEMEMLCNQLKTSKQPIYQNAAASIIDVLNDLREDVRQAAELAKKAASVTSGAESDFKAPAPATAEQKAA
jgi:hypothetical protein